MEESTIWWLAAGAVVVAELLTGTFYLLMVAIGLVAAALAAHLGLPIALQIVSAAVFGGGAVVAWYLVKKRRPGDPSARADRSVNLDVGETIMIESWNPDGTTSVKYRGATWTAIHRAGVTPSTGMHRVSELVGNRLLVDPV
ncbi:MAG: NfeD family protein [Gammaproteobacteria bacterium]|jgi:membrane protein implicated in regulation of membrane protease activity|nr:NfeD family protein [Gammaproteobacteria bacterium]MBU0828533.1 NfeD family protein [Gammaproteobacteria bacterium]MBU0892127.1 NfeD family protein [Gammaproteobacteria bacterium]MBU1818267.1 NfeD family protein [Gammaproteobacteria bacterium]